MPTYQADDVNNKVLLAHLLLDIGVGGLRDGLGVDLDRLEGCQYLLSLIEYSILPRGTWRCPGRRWQPSCRPRPPQVACQGCCPGQTCEAPCSPWQCGL